MDKLVQFETGRLGGKRKEPRAKRGVRLISYCYWEDRIMLQYCSLPCGTETYSTVLDRCV